MPEFDASLPVLAGVAALAYLLGSVPFGLVAARLFGLPDPRTIGSKNIGATNVLRTGSKGAAATTLLLDALKGLVAVVLARWLVGDGAAQIAALFAFLGHCYSVFLGFKGGKGVATFLGAVYGLAFPVGIAASLIWLITCVATRYSSLSALVAAFFTPVVAALIVGPHFFVVLSVMAFVLAWRHRENISRLLAGTEAKVGAKST
jgi:glycerol-3-phosphate acyltransferase PlsY